MSKKNLASSTAKKEGTGGTYGGGKGPQTTYNAGNQRFSGARDSRPKGSDPRQTAK